MVVRDKQLVQGALEGDRIAFGMLVEKYKRQVLGMCYTFTKSFHDTEDLAQTVFIKAFKSLGNLNEPDKFPAWLSKITYSTCKDWLRKEKREAISLQKLQESGRLKKPLREAIIDQEELDQIIAAALDEMPENLQLVLTMRFYDGLGYRDIADFLELPVSSVRGMIYRGTQLLRKSLNAYITK